MTLPRPLADAAARARVRGELDASLLCLAGAGVGKTQALVERMVAIVAGGHAEVGELAAITFTRKAAGELRGRFFQALQEALDQSAAEANADAARRTRRLRAARDGIDRCAIGTIHAFCARLLRERPVEAGLPPDFTEIEEREELWLVREAWDRFLEARAAAGDERLAALEAAGLTAEPFYDFYLRRCQYGDLPLKPTSQPRPDLGPTVAQVGDWVQQVAATIPAPLPDGRPDSLMRTVRRLDHRLRVAPPADDAGRAALLRELASSSGTQVTLKRWGTRGSQAYEAARNLRDRVLPELQREVLEPVLGAWRRHVYVLAADLVDDAMAAYGRARRAAATLTFNDLLEQAAALLRDRPEVRAAFQRRYRRLFVDEFQDTDPLQAEVLLYLTGQDLSERDWRRLTPAPGSLFVVGDEQQSIYRFRRADVDVFRHMRERIVAGGGGVVELTTSFRARPELAAWLNGAFEALFDNDEPRYQAEFRPLVAHRAPAPGARVYGLRPGADTGRPRQDQVAEEAQRIAAFIAAACDGRTEWNGSAAVLGPRASAGDFMVLTRTRKHLADYARALEAAGVPYDVTGAGSLRDSFELRALVDALEAVLSADDPVPLVAYLRGPLVGLGDDELYRLHAAGWAFRWPAPVPADLEAPLGQHLETARQSLRTLAADLDRRPAAAALERFVEASGLLAQAASGAAGSSRAGNLLRVLALVRDAEARRGLAWPQVAAQLRDLLDDDTYRVEEMTLETGRQDVVRVMNLHQAKGLEAKVVFLADPADAGGVHEPEVHVSRLGVQPYLAMTAGRRREVLAEPEGWAADCEEERRFLEAETLRLVYVAATRARDVLVVGGAGARKGAWSALSGACGGLPDLPRPAAGARRPLPEPAPDSAGLDPEAQSAARLQAWQRAATPGFTLETVTDDEALPAGREVDGSPAAGGRGRRYGTAVHRLFESAVTGRLAGLDAAAEALWVRALLAEAGLGDGEAAAALVQAALGALTDLRASDIWRELTAAGSQVHTEVAFAEATATGVRRGVIDLVYRVEADDGTAGWKLVDYKTDRPAPGSQRAVHYAAQLAAYAEHWTRVSGEPVLEKGLWLAGTGGDAGFVPL